MFDQSKVKVAFNILKKVKDILSKNEGIYYLECYQNGRESGFCINNNLGDKFVAFSENRNSDDIVVYTSNVPFNMAGNIPSDEVYQQRKFFNYRKTKEAAEFIVEFLTA